MNKSEITLKELIEKYRNDNISNDCYASILLDALKFCSYEDVDYVEYLLIKYFKNIDNIYNKRTQLYYTDEDIRILFKKYREPIDRRLKILRSCSEGTSEVEINIMIYNMALEIYFLIREREVKD